MLSTTIFALGFSAPDLVVTPAEPVGWRTARISTISPFITSGSAKRLSRKETRVIPVS